MKQEPIALDVLGWHLDAALSYLRQHNLKFRVIYGNGLVTADLDFERANLYVEGEKITKINYG